MNTKLRYMFNYGHNRGKTSLMLFISLAFVLLLIIYSFSPIFSGVAIFAHAAPSAPAPEEFASSEVDLIDIIAAIADGGEVVIGLQSDIQLTASLSIPDDKHVILVSAGNNDEMYQLIGADGEDTIVIVTGGLLSLYDVIITHNDDESGRGITINSGGKLVMYDGEISNNKIILAPGGGVHNNGGIFEMSGGVIVSNSAYDGGGVCNSEGAEFIMNSGVIGGSEIDKNIAYAGAGGGVCNSVGCIFEMISGEISYNDGNSAGGVYNGGTFDMRGGEISNNNVTGAGSGGGGVFNRGVFNMFSGEISYNFGSLRGGGVYNANDLGSAAFIMHGGKIFGNTAEYMGGGVYLYSTGRDSCTFTMIGGEIFNNMALHSVDYTGFGGGVANDYGEFIMDGGEIYGNTAISGGGVFNLGTGVHGAFTMNGGIIGGVTSDKANSADLSGGGVSNYYDGTFVMNDGAICGNTAQYGGGVYLYTDAVSVFNMFDGEISYNSASYGGGIYLNGMYALCTVSGGVISDNSAIIGGGIWVRYEYLSNLQVAAGVVFADNSAHVAYDIDPLDDYAVDAYANNIYGTIWSIFGQGYNNYDISYTNGLQAVVYSVTVQDSYAPTSGAGNYAAGESVTINAGTHTGYSFSGWTINTDDITLDNNPTTTFTMPDKDVIITANWTPQNDNDDDEDLYAVTYYGNGHTGGVVPVDSFGPYVKDSLVIVLSQGSLKREGYTFLGWATNPSTTEATYLAGSTFIISDDTVLYAVWAEIFFTVEYQPGTHGTFDTQVTSGLSYGDTTPAAPIVTGENGWTFAGWYPTISTTVTGNAVYIAQWEQELSVPSNDDGDGGGGVFVVKFVDWDGRLLKTETVPYGGSATAPANPARENYTFTGWDRAFTTVTSDLTITAQYTPNVAPTQSPIITPHPDVDGDEDKEPLMVWAFVNLVLSIVGIALAIIGVIFMLLQHKLADKEEKTVDDKLVVDNSDTRVSRNRWWLIVAFALSIIGVVVFLLTENMSHQMVLIDKWTIINAVIFVAEIVAILIYSNTKKEDDKQTTYYNNQSTK